MINCFFDFRFVDPLRRYSRSKSKVVRNCEKFAVFPLPNFRGQAFQKLYPRYNPWLAARCLEKNCDDIPISSELIDVYTLNFKPNFSFLRLKIFWGTSSACKNFRVQPPVRAEIQSPEKCALRWVNTHVNNFFVCGPKFKNFFIPTWEGS